MTIQVRFFANLREQTGISSTKVEAHGLNTVRDLWQTFSDEPLNANILIAVNKTYAEPDHVIQDGDEVAFFPPITGG